MSLLPRSSRPTISTRPPDLPRTIPISWPRAERRGGGSTALNAAQCAQARSAAQAFSSRYDYFNGVTGRTGWIGLVPAPAKTYVPLQAAGRQGSGINLDDDCCLQGSAAVYASNACTPSSTNLPLADCATVCCVVSGTTTQETAYQCSAQGGTATTCGSQAQ